MNNDDQNQAAKLQELFVEVTQNERVDDQDSNQTEIKSEDEFVDNESINYEIDILNLSPRSEVHLSKSKKIKLTLNRPLVRFLLVIILLIGITIGAYYVIGFEQFLSVL